MKHIRLCDNLNCWNLVEIDSWSARVKMHHFCCRSCYKAWWRSNNPTQTEEAKKKARISLEPYWARGSTEETRKKRSASLKRHYKEHPEVRIKRSASLKQAHKERPEWGRKASELFLTNNPMKYSLYRQKVSAKKIEWWQNPDNRQLMSDLIKLDRLNRSNGAGTGSNRGKGAYVFDHRFNKKWLRSSLEIRYSGILNSLHEKWDYEIKSFKIDSINCSYRPDFYLPDKDVWIEVKGWFDDTSKTKMIEFYKQYSNYNFLIVYVDHIKLLEHELGCYVPINLLDFGITIRDQILMWNKEENRV